MAKRDIDLEDVGLLGQIYHQALKMLNLKEHSFKLAYPFIQWIWPDSPPGYIDPNVFTIVDEMPVAGWFYRSSGTGLYSGYKSMLGVAPKLTENISKELEDVQKIVDSAWDDLKAIEKELRKAWIKDYSADPSIVYDEWISTSGWMEKNQAAQDKFDEAISKKIEAIKDINEDYMTAVNACKMPKSNESSKPGFVKTAGKGQEFWYPSYVINNGQAWDDRPQLSTATIPTFELMTSPTATSSNIPTFEPKTTTSSSGDIKFELGANIPTFEPMTSTSKLGADISTFGHMTSSLAANIGLSTENAWVESAALALENPNIFSKDSKLDDTLSFFATRGSDDKWHAFDIKKDKNYKVSLEIGKSKIVPVQPGTWYNGTYLQDLAKDNQWNHPFTTETPPSSVFGKDGIVSFRVTEIIAGCHVKFSISLSPAEYQLHVHTFLTSISFRIGPFLFGPNQHKGEMALTKSADEQNCLFHGETSGNDWFILGFLAESPGL